jgi:hypothetical protein
MFVSQYATYIQPQQSKRVYATNQSDSTQKKGEFDTQLENFEIFQTAPIQKQQLLPIDYQHSKNYYANRYKLHYQKKQPQEVEVFKKQYIQTALPKTYNAVFTSLYDIVQPKKALIQPYQIETQNPQYDALQKQIKQKQMLYTYSANEIYYQRTHAS